MPLQHLVEYFNDRLGREHRSSFRPFVLDEGKVSGLFGPIQIGSHLKPLRQALQPDLIVGHLAQIAVAPNTTQYLYSNEIESLLENNTLPSADFDSIINFDRLSRTVHMLNYLSFIHLDGTLFLEVDPRHILGVKQDHGAYFQEVITQCGLETNNVAIVLSVNSQYANYYQDLIKGLDNYRHRGYKIALKFDYLIHDSEAFNLIEKITPHYVSLSARNMGKNVHDEALLTKLIQLNAKIASLDSISILQQVNEKGLDLLALNSGFNFVEGDYYTETALDYSNNTGASAVEFSSAFW